MIFLHHRAASSGRDAEKSGRKCSEWSFTVQNDIGRRLGWRMGGQNTWTTHQRLHFLHPSEVQAAKDGVKAERHRPQKLRHRTDKNKNQAASGSAALPPSPGGLRDNELCRRKVDHFLPGEITMVTDDEYITWCGAGDVQSFDLKSAAELNKSTEWSTDSVTRMFMF